jgi:hypothetical protein
MRIPPTPAYEAQRLAALHECDVLDTPPEPPFEDAARLASHVCGVPIALVSLVDQDRQWFKARVGLAAPETSRDRSFCAHAIVTPEMPLVVRDTLTDERFFDNPLVTSDPNIRFYAGVPLTLGPDATVGTLCVIDRVPRDLTAAQMDALNLIARQICTELKLRREVTVLRTQPPGQRRGPLAGRRGLPAALQVDIVAGRYRLEELIGAGGMGVVVSATDSHNGRRVAVKFVLPEAASERLLERFVREARALLRVDGDHVTRVLDVGNLGNGAPFIVMERLVGEDLDCMLSRRGMLPIAEAVDYLVQACEGVAAVHAAGIVHRDLKPSNLYLARQDGGAPVLKILDFGVARLAALDEPGLTGHGIVGSPQYMAPEQMTLGAPVDERADLWSLGVVLYELLAYRRPFEGEGASQVCARALREGPMPLQQRRPDVPDELAAVVDRCLAKSPEHRYGSARELGAALLAAVGADAATWAR